MCIKDDHWCHFNNALHLLPKQTVVSLPPFSSSALPHMTFKFTIPPPSPGTPAHHLFHLEPLLAYEHLPLDESRWLILPVTWKSTIASRTWPSNLQDSITLSGEGIFSNPTLAQVQVEPALMTIVFKHGKGAVLPPLHFHCLVLLQGVISSCTCFWLCGSASKEMACNAGDLGLIPGLGRSPGERKGYPLQYSDLENSMDVQSMRLQRVGDDRATFTFTFTLQRLQGRAKGSLLF